jgi:uncharacterized repeat protein (TIGR03803 family)
MQSKEQFCNLISRTISRAATVALAIATVFALTVVLTQSAQAQTYNVIHNFTGEGDGANPQAGFTMDQAGNFYGTTSRGGRGDGTVYRLSNKGSNWVVNPLYTFSGVNDGSAPSTGVIFGTDGSLYGTTYAGGGSGVGTVFSVKPSAIACKTALCPWTETVLYRFTGGGDGANPYYGELIFDQAGNLYGTTLYGGAYGYGAVFELVTSQGGWTESVLYSFTGGNDGWLLSGGLVFDKAGNLYGTALLGGDYNGGTVYQLTPSGSGWTENTLYSFQGGNDGDHPYPGLIFDQSGNLYGATADGGQGGSGAVFELTPSGGAWKYTLIYSLIGGFNCGPSGNLMMDGAGNLYGATNCDGAYGLGSVFKLTPAGGNWTYTSLHDFTGGSDGKNAGSVLMLDKTGNLWGTAYAGGSHGLGVVWEITP